MLTKIISGGQTGVDIAGLEAAYKTGFITGGTMPKGFKTLAGPQPEYRDIYGIVEDNSEGYVSRTHKNVEDSDGTIRYAYNFDSPGEKCTLKAILKYNRPHLDIDAKNPMRHDELLTWLDFYAIGTLNIAGNSETTAPGIYSEALLYFEQFFSYYKRLAR